MSTANQQTLAESGTKGRPPILDKGSYVPWASQFLRFLDNKREEGELMRNSIDDCPFKQKEIDDPNNAGKKMYKPIKDLSTKDRDQYYANIKVMNYILQAIPNDIYNPVDACEDAQGMWQRFAAKACESLTSVYERFSTLVNNINQNKVKLKEIAINTKFLNSLQHEWGKYVTLTRQYHTLITEHFDKLYDYLSQSEHHVNDSRAKKAAGNHDPLALVANSYANPSYSHAIPSYSRLPPPYYVTRPPSVHDYDDDYQGEIQRDA
ncbi:hypothetical protein Tco_0507658 [Tanacetum coccineum]